MGDTPLPNLDFSPSSLAVITFVLEPHNGLFSRSNRQVDVDETPVQHRRNIKARDALVCERVFRVTAVALAVELQPSLCPTQRLIDICVLAAMWRCAAECVCVFVCVVRARAN